MLRECLLRIAESKQIERLMQPLLESGHYHAIVTHDQNMIAETKAFATHHAIPKNAFEFQMFYGICTDLQQQLVREEYMVRIYVPFGEDQLFV